MEPESGSSRPAMMLKIVVLPAGADDADEVAVVDVKAEVVEHPDRAGLAVKGFSNVPNTELG
jgi:hypothetical protein